MLSSTAYEGGLAGHGVYAVGDNIETLRQEAFHRIRVYPAGELTEVPVGVDGPGPLDGAFLFGAPDG